MKIRISAAFVLITLLVFGRVCQAEYAPADIKIDQTEKRMKATIPAENSDAPGRGPNIIDRGAGVVGHGVYYAAKTAVDGVGKGMDAAVNGVRMGGRAVYGWLARPFLKKNEE